jgi:hypothetical protein
METPYRLKVKIGEHEFEAEGSVDAVQAQFAAFKEMIQTVPTTAREPQTERQEPGNGDVNPAVLPLEKITKNRGRVISLTAHSRAVRDVILMILLGQKVLRSNELVTGGELVDGLRDSGHAVVRVDTFMEKLIVDGFVLKVGVGRATKYRLTNIGATRAEELARELIKIVA